ncbi:prolipoprotein diacylglyceryl transferase family protein [Pseudoduganella plicata]|uniref:Thiol:disulfide interchange protein n=1 Tax=Pseudoduganella plicata TaxID=321984 RepID=A0A4P7BED9_9BURK|nr:TlpA disulfide reductase family protein [Pseudoduganella plicata]QBQ36553.1 TlpA family protein disulfide reductase [Pseudoduganella plicata]GGY74435.1 thiol:disulfide interchange protein [Pseudoduganella plicata]
MDSIQLGPIVIPAYALLALAGLGTANAAGAWFRRFRGVDPGAAFWKMTVAGFVVARLVFVLRNADLYVDSPLSAFNFRDGGFATWAGWFAALVVGMVSVRTNVPLRRPLLVATLAGAAVWFGGTMFNRALAPQLQPLPSMDVRRLDGAVVALDRFRGRPLVVNLWATWCGPCRREMPALKAAQHAHPGVTFVFVNQGESEQEVQRFLSGQRLELRNVVLDPARELGTRTHSPGYPTTLFYDAAGTLRFRHVGELSQAAVREHIAALSERR